MVVEYEMSQVKFEAQSRFGNIIGLLSGRNYYINRHHLPLSDELIM